MNMEELIKFWKLSATGSGSRIYLKASATLQEVIFSTIWFISL